MEERPTKKGSWRSRVVRGTKKIFGKAKNLYHNPTKSRLNKAKQIGTTFMNTAVGTPFKHAANKTNPLYKRIPAGAAGFLGATTAIAGVGTALGVGAATATIGGITRVAAPVVGTAIGTGVGLAKGAVEAPFRTGYGIGKVLYKSPSAAFKGIKYSFAKRRFQKRTGFSNRTLSNIEQLVNKEKKAKTALEDLEKRQEEKLKKKAPIISNTAFKNKLDKYKKQREILEAKIAKRTADLETAVEKKLTKTRFAKAKRGKKTDFTLEAKRTNGESNDDFGKRIGLNKKTNETNAKYTARLNSYQKQAGETSANYLKRRISNTYEEQKAAYNKAITQKTKDKQIK